MTVLAVTESVKPKTIRNLVGAGLTDLAATGSKQLAEQSECLDAYLARRRNGLPDRVRWHMVGPLQRSQVRPALETAGTIHSVDSLRLAEEINVRADKLGRSVDAFLKINCGEGPKKLGCAVGAATHLAELICTLPRLRLIGLMTLGHPKGKAELSRPIYVRLRELFEEMRKDRIGGRGMRHLSMGTSADYVAAVEEGATMVRIGAALFKQA